MNLLCTLTKNNTNGVTCGNEAHGVCTGHAGHSKRINVSAPGWMQVMPNRKVVLVELGLWWDVTGQPSTVYLLFLLTSVFSFSLSPFYFAHPSPLCGLGINHSLISLLILFLLTSCYHFVVPFTPPFTRFEIAVWAKLQFISTSWQRYAELIAGRKWTSQQNQLARAGSEWISNADVHLWEALPNNLFFIEISLFCLLLSLKPYKMSLKYRM